VLSIRFQTVTHFTYLDKLKLNMSLDISDQTHSIQIFINFCARIQFLVSIFSLRFMFCGKEASDLPMQVLFLTDFSYYGIYHRYLKI